MSSAAVRIFVALILSTRARALVGAALVVAVSACGNRSSRPPSLVVAAQQLRLKDAGNRVLASVGLSFTNNVRDVLLSLYDEGDTIAVMCNPIGNSYTNVPHVTNL